jgi:RNA polymerase sigma-70 factor (ECF subfamily)
MSESIVHWNGLEGLEPELRRYLRRRCRDASEADDVVQETLLRAARYRPGLVEPQRIHGWIQRIAANVLRDLRRREGRHGRVEVDGWRGLDRLQGREPAPGEVDQEAYLRVGGLALERGMLLEHLACVLGMLRDGDRRVLSSYYHGEGSSARAALELGIARRLVKVRLYRARQRLSRMLRQRLAEAEVGVFSA